MQGALKEPASRFGPVVSSSPPRISKSGRAVHVQHPKSGLATEHAESKLMQSFFFKQTSSKLMAPSSTVSVPNALQLSRGPPRISKDLTVTSKLLDATHSLNHTPQHRAFATSTGARTEATMTRKPPKSAKVIQKNVSPEELEAEGVLEPEASTPVQLPVYDYSTYTPKPTKKYTRISSEAERELEGMVGPLGFDIEWTVVRRKGAAQRPVAMVQIADQRKVLIMQTSAMKVFPKKLKEILEDATIIKVGVNVRGDAKKMYTDHKIKIQNLVELSWLSRQADSKLRCGGKASARTLISLQKLAAAYLGKDLVKSDIRTGNWDMPLTVQQTEYAANDAHCSVILHHHLVQLAKTDKRTLKPHIYTLNANLAGEVVSAVEEIAPSDEVDALDVEEALSSASLPPPPPAPVRAKGNTKPAPKSISFSKQPEIIELSDSEEEELRQLDAHFREIRLEPNSTRVSRTMAFALGLK